MSHKPTVSWASLDLSISHRPGANCMLSFLAKVTMVSKSGKHWAKKKFLIEAGLSLIQIQSSRKTRPIKDGASKSELPIAKLAGT